MSILQFVSINISMWIKQRQYLIHLRENKSRKIFILKSSMKKKEKKFNFKKIKILKFNKN